MRRTYEDYWQEMQKAISNLPHEKISIMRNWLEALPDKGGKLLIIGNGGSASTADHASCDLSKGLMSTHPTKRFQAISLTSNTSLLTAWSNDNSYADALKQLVLTLANKEDMLLAISGSGNSKNIIHAIEAAKDMNLRTVGLTGFDGGEMRRLVDLEVHVDSTDMQVIENIHLAVIHSMIKACGEFS